MGRSTRLMQPRLLVCWTCRSYTIPYVAGVTGSVRTVMPPGTCVLQPALPGQALEEGMEEGVVVEDQMEVRSPDAPVGGHQPVELFASGMPLDTRNHGRRLRAGLQKLSPYHLVQSGMA